jgi:hypothetical protein
MAMHYILFPILVNRKMDPKLDQSASASDGGSDEAVVNVTPVPKPCELCDEEPISVKFLPCGHAVLCKLCAIRAVKCLECKVNH